MEFSLQELVQATKGKVISEVQKSFSGVGTDTRQDLTGQIFIALKGDAFDAHHFLAKAVEKGASAIVIHQDQPDVETIKSKVTVIKVSDTLMALQNLANFSRHRSSAKIIGVAGSNGKTTSKEFCAAVISQSLRLHFSQGSFNNHWGVPFTLLAQPNEAQVSIVEMGMNHAGELARLAEIAEPDICVVTYVGVEHIEHFGTLEKISEAEEEIYEKSPATSTRIYNLDNKFTLAMYEKAKKKFSKARLMTFSLDKKLAGNVDVHFQVVQATMRSLKIKGHIAGTLGLVEVPVFGVHNITNLMVAASCALAMDIVPEKIWESLKACKTTWGRNQLLKTKSGAEILFDGYNSNPDSMLALMENVNLLKTSGKKIGIFAEMRELGDLAPRFHKEVGMAVGRAGFDLIWFYGPSHNEFKEGILDSACRGELLINKDFDESMAKTIAARLSGDDIVLCKGSRGMKLERFVELCQPLNFD